MSEQHVQEKFSDLYNQKMSEPTTTIPKLGPDTADEAKTPGRTNGEETVITLVAAKEKKRDDMESQRK
jgi:hypothetical protein